MCWVLLCVLAARALESTECIRGDDPRRSFAQDIVGYNENVGGNVSWAQNAQRLHVHLVSFIEALGATVYGLTRTRSVREAPPIAEWVLILFSVGAMISLVVVSCSRSSETDIRRKLEKAGVDTSEWGCGSSKSFEDLTAEIATGCSELEWVTEHDSKTLRRVVRIVTCAMYADADGKTYELMQTSVSNWPGKSPQSARRQRVKHLSVKLRSGETAESAAARAVQDQLGLRTWQHLELDAGTAQSFTHHSDGQTFGVSWPGLPSAYITTHFRGSFNISSGDCLSKRQGEVDIFAALVSGCEFSTVSTVDQQTNYTWRWYPSKSNSHTKPDVCFGTTTEQSLELCSDASSDESEVVYDVSEGLSTSSSHSEDATLSMTSFHTGSAKIRTEFSYASTDNSRVG